MRENKIETQKHELFKNDSRILARCIVFMIIVSSIMNIGTFSHCIALYNHNQFNMFLIKQ